VGLRDATIHDLERRPPPVSERIARDAADGLPHRVDQQQARGLWARLRNKRGA